MTLYNIDQSIMSMICPETGEILDLEKFEELQLTRVEKIENIALWYKELKARAAAIKAEKAELAARQTADERNMERLSNLLAYYLAGQKYETPKVALSFRKSSRVEVGDDFVEWAKTNCPEALTYDEPKPNKTVIKGLLESNDEIKFFAQIVESQNLQVK